MARCGSPGAVSSCSILRRCGSKNLDVWADVAAWNNSSNAVAQTSRRGVWCLPIARACVELTASCKPGHMSQGEYARISELIMNGIMRGIPTPYPTLMKGDITHNVLVERVTCESLPEHMDPTLDLQCRVLVGRCPTPARVCTFMSSRGQGRAEGYRTIHEAQHRVEGLLAL